MTSKHYILPYVVASLILLLQTSLAQAQVNIFMGTSGATAWPTGNLYDSGGPSSNYSNSENHSLLIQPVNITSITLTISSFSSQSCCDILRIYDGTSASGTLLASISGSLTQIPTELTATSGSMYITWTSNISQVASGWSSSWTSGTPPPPPPILGPLPTITSFSPTMGNIGMVDTIIGTNFSTIPADNVVYFGASRAQVLSATTTQLLVNVPLGITHKPISVTRNGLTAFSSKPYSTTFSYTGSISPSSFSSNGTSSSLASVKANYVADLNNDGKPDFIEASLNTISIRKNVSQQGTLSQASFAPPIYITGQSDIFDLKTGDIDGDGWLDIIISNGSNPVVYVFRNQMSGNGGMFNTSSFGSRNTVYVGGTNNTYFQVADIDGDGKVEILIPTISYSNVSVVKNNSTPGVIAFNAPLNFTTATNPSDIGVADMDNDGKLDIVVCNSGSNSISILKNTSTSTNINFNPRVDFPATNNLTKVRLCDIDNDNKIDLSYISGTNVYIRRNNSVQGIINSTSLGSIVTLAANTTSNITDFEFVEINGDGKLDLVTCYSTGSSYSAWQNNAISGAISTASFSSRIDFLNLNGGQLLTTFDVDGDKRNDLLFNNNNFLSLNFVKNQSTIFAINSMSVSSYVPGAPIQIPFTFTLLANPGNTFTAQLSDSSGSFANPIYIGNMLSTTSGVITGMIPMYIPAGQNYRIRIVSDFPSLTSDESSSPIRIFIPPVITSVVPQKANPGQTIVINGNNFSSVNTENIIHFGTMRGTVLSASSTQLSVLVPNGVTNAAISVSVSSYTAFSPEIFQVAYIGTGNITSTTFGTPTSLTAGSSASNPMNVEMCDVDQDRRPDIVVPRNGPSSPTGNSIFRNLSSNGTTVFGGSVNFASASTASNSQMIDIDGDGWKDLITINSGAPTLSINKKVNEGTNIVSNSFLSRIDYTTAGNPNGLTYGDIDRDGKIDLVTANFSANNISIFRNISTIGTIDNTSFATRMDLSTGANSGPISVLLHDVNADGWVDMIVANSLNNTIAIYSNTSTVGAISFATPMNYASNSSPRSMVVDDINDDGRPDLLVTNQGSSNFSIYQNNSSTATINFLSKVDFTTGNGPMGIATGDINGDGKVDVAVCNMSSNTITLHQNIHSSGIISTLSLAAPLSILSISQPNGIAICDINEDLRPELIVSSHANGTINVFPNNTPYISADLISGQICSGSNMNIGYTTTINFNLGNIFTVQLSDEYGDFSNPFTLGFVSATTSGSINVTLPSYITLGGKYRIRIVSSSPALISNDNRSPLSMTNCPQITSITPLSGPSGTTLTISGNNFSSNPSENLINVGGIIVPAQTANFNNVTATIPDGNSYKPISLTLLTNNTTAYSKDAFNSTYIGSNAPFGASTYNTGVQFTSIISPRHVTCGDLDGDGKQDIVITSEAASSIEILRNIGTTGQGFTSSSIVSVLTIPTGGSPSQSVLGDIDGDGKLDLVVFISSPTQINIFKNISTIGNLAFATRVTLPSGSLIKYGTLADVDNDGKLDIIATHANQSFISIFKNNTTSGNIDRENFSNRTSVISPNNLVFIKPCDLDNDGKTDFVAGGSSLSNITVMRNVTGVISSTMFSNFNISTGSTISPFVNVADMDNDGNQDIIVTRSSLSRISVYRNLYIGGTLSASSFASAVNILPNTSAFSTSIADINGDNKLDIISGNNSTTGSVAIIKNNSTIGALSFDSSYSYTGFYDVGFVETADLNMDGKQDIIAVNSGLSNFKVLINNIETYAIGNMDGGTYCSGTSISVPFSAPNGQFISGNTFTAQLSDSSGSFSNPSIIGSTTGTSSGTISGNLPIGIPPGANYRIRIVSTSPAYTSTSSNNIRILSCPVITNFTPLAAAPNAVVTINGLNFSSSLIGNTVWFGSTKATVLTASSTTITVSVPHGAIVAPITLTVGSYATTSKQQFVPTFAGNSSISASSFATRTDVVNGVTGLRSVKIADFDEDGKVDLSVITTSANRLNQYKNTATSTTFSSANFLSTTNNTTSNQPWQHVLADFDNDGKLDMAVTNSNSNTLSIFRNTSSLNNISTALKVDFTTGTTPYGIAAGDIDGDGFIDLVVTNSGSNTISLFRNISTGNTINFAAKVDFTTLVQPNAVVITELDGDGKADIMISCFGSNQLSFFRNISSTGIINNNSLAARGDINSGTAPFSISSADVDSDGKNDIIVPNYSSNNISVIRNISTIGNILFATAQSFVTQNAPSNIGLGDVDGDGKADILVTNQSTNSISVFKNNSTSGTITLDTAVNITHAGGPISLVLGDMNNDARPDLVVANNTGNSVSVLLNATVAASPTTASTSLSLSAITANSITLNWNNGNGSRRIVVARASATANAIPVDGSDYTANNTFGTGTMLGTNNFVVYNGNGNTVTVNGLLANTNYIFTVYEYNGTGGSINYLTTPNLSNNGTTLPVQLVSFCAKYITGDVVLNWVTASELNNKGFFIERSVDNKIWEPVNFVKGNGNSNVTNTYTYTDVNVAQLGVNDIYYRLIQQDYSGKEEVLPTRVVNLSMVDAPVNVSVFPNPAQSTITISAGNQAETLSSFTVTNMLGNAVLEGSLNQSENAQLDISALAAGTYYLKVITNNGVKVVKLVKQ